MFDLNLFFSQTFKLVRLVTPTVIACLLVEKRKVRVSRSLPPPPVSKQKPVQLHFVLPAQLLLSIVYNFLPGAVPQPGKCLCFLQIDFIISFLFTFFPKGFPNYLNVYNIWQDVEIRTWGRDDDNFREAGGYPPPNANPVLLFITQCIFSLVGYLVKLCR